MGAGPNPVPLAGGSYVCGLQVPDQEAVVATPLSGGDSTPARKPPGLIAGKRLRRKNLLSQKRRPAEPAERQTSPSGWLSAAAL
jgi:hypothetical protein